MGDYLPSIAARWTSHYALHPLGLVGGVTLVFVLMAAGASLQARIGRTMLELWAHVRAGQGSPGAGPPRGAIYRLRTHGAYQAVVSGVRETLMPTAFGFLSLLVLSLGLAWLAVGLVTRGTFEVASRLGRVCSPPPGSEAPILRSGTTLVPGFAPQALCFPTAVSLERGVTYRVRLSLPAGPGVSWRDDSVPVTTPAGFTSGAPELSAIQRVVFRAALPLRRIWGAAWFVPMARIGEHGADHYALDGECTEFVARQSGRLYLFVNDAVLPWPLPTDRLYQNNRGGSPEIEIARVGAVGPPACAPDHRGSALR
jgi:hypothetical protein